MSDDLEVSLAGSVGVSTDELLGMADAYGRVWMSLECAAASLGTTRQLMLDSFPGGPSDPRAAEAQWSIWAAMDRVTLLATTATASKDRILAASLSYGDAEAASEWVMQAVTSSYMYTIGMTLGPLLPLWLLFAPPGAEDDEPVPITDLAAKEDPSLSNLFLNTAVTDEGRVDLARNTVSGMDDLIGGSLGLGLGTTFLLGEQGLGLVNGATVGASALMVGGSKFGTLMEGPVAVARVETSSTIAPMGVQQRTDRIPGTVSDRDDGGQVTVIRYSAPGAPDRFEVFVAGTVTFDFTSRGEPLDMTSNIGGVAGVNPGAQRVVELAMADAGVTPDSDVSFVGYSQGGLIASLVASSGSYNTQSLLTIAAPAGNVAIPESINAMVISHNDDPVPALGGVQQNDVLLINRTVFDEGAPIPADVKVPAHHYEYYQHTAELIDAADSAVVRDATAGIDSISAGATEVTAITYRGYRTDAGP